MEFADLVSPVNVARRVVSAPLTWFALLGAILFAFDHHRQTDKQQTITVHSGDIQRLQDQWRAQTGEAPNEQEMTGLLAEFVLERRLAKEARALGLDTKDVIIERRLAQKLRFLKEDQFDETLLTEDALKIYFAEHRQDYVRPATLSFRHVFLHRKNRQDNLEKDADEILSGLRSGDAAAEWRSLGDPFMPGRWYASASEDEIRRDYGDSFTNALRGLEPGHWHGPIRSDSGIHIVILDAIEATQQMHFAQAQQQVLHDVRAHHRALAFERFRKSLEDKYPVVFDRDTKPSE